MSFLLAEGTVRLARPGFPGFALPQVDHEPAAGIGYRMVPDQAAYTYAEPVAVNSRGLRGPEIPPDATGFRIICLGDSFTFGVGVGDEQTYPAQLAALLRKRRSAESFEVINAGVQGYATYQEIQWLKTRGTEFNPSCVVLAVYFNDLVVPPEGDCAERFRQRQREAASKLRHRAPRAYWLVRNSAVVSLLGGAALSSRHSTSSSDMLEGRETPEVKRQWEAMEQQLAEFREVARRHGFEPLVITIPARVQVLRGFPKSLYPSRVESICGRLNIAIIDVSPAVRQCLDEGVDPYLPWDNHLSPAGNRVVAEEIYRSLEELLP